MRGSVGLAHLFRIASHILMVAGDTLHDSTTREDVHALIAAAACYPNVTFLLHHNDGVTRQTTSDNLINPPRRYWSAWQRWTGLEYARSHNM